VIIFSKIRPSPRCIIFVVTAGRKFFLVSLIVGIVWHMRREALAIRRHKKNSPSFSAGVARSRSSIGTQSLVHFIHSNTELEPIIFEICLG
jgi:hypothetical protein